jgi:TPR repeat protein
MCFLRRFYGKSSVGLPGMVELLGKNGGNVVPLVDPSEADTRLLQQTADETVKEWQGGRTPPPVAPSPEITYNLSLIRFAALIGKKDYPEAFKLMRQIADASKDDPAKQNELAWMIVTDKSIEHPDLDLAETLAQRAVDGANEPSTKSQFMDTLARVKFMKGNKEEAIDLEQKALALARAGDKDALQKTLDSYKKGELPDVN